MYKLTVMDVMIDHCVDSEQWYKDGKLWSEYAGFIEKYGESAATSVFLDWLYDEISDEIQKNAFPDIRPLLWDLLEVIFEDIDETELEDAALEKIKEQKRNSWRVV